MKRTPQIVILLILTALALAVPVRGHTADIDAVWLARSCVGEAGWSAWHTGECAAILHIYKKRAARTGETVTQMAKRYSAAIKPHSGRNNTWVLSLRADGKRPDSWPRGAKWGRYSYSWQMTLLVVELFLLGMVADPLPMAIHYGASFDVPAPGSVRIKTIFRNRFYR